MSRSVSPRGGLGSLSFLRQARPESGAPRRRPARAWVVECLEDRRVPATIPVTSLADAGPGTLRAAITQADLDATPDTITFGPALTGTITLASALPDLTHSLTIAGPGPSALTVARSAASGTPDFRIFTVPAGAEVTISGLTVSGGNAIDGGGISNAGMLTLTDSAVSGNSAAGDAVGNSYGGGIYNTGTLTVTDSTLSGNSATGVVGHGLNFFMITYNGSGNGGGIFNSGALTVTNSTLSGNSAVGTGFNDESFLRLVSPGNAVGGGIENQGTLTVASSTLSGNTAVVMGYGSAAGGGIENSGKLTVTYSTLSGNSTSGGSAGNGGGIDNLGAITVSNSTLSGNAALGEGGTVQENDGYAPFAGLGSGGGIENQGTLTVTNSTISGNSAQGDSARGDISFAPGVGNGGGIDNQGSLTVISSTLSGNSAKGDSASGFFSYTPSVGNGGGIDNQGSLTVTDSTLSDNSALSTPPYVNTPGPGNGGGINNAGGLMVGTSIFANTTGGNIAVVVPMTQPAPTFVSLGHNLFTDAPTGLALLATDLTNTDPLLAPLAGNGGPTQTMALLPGSPAIDAGAAVPGVTTDQRGVSRPKGRAPDIGAFESRGFKITVVSGSRQSAPPNSPFPAPLVVAVSSPFGEPVAGGVVTFAPPATGPSASLAGNPATLGANGQASVRATSNGLVGAYTFTVGAAGADSVELTLTNQVAPTSTSLSASPNPSSLGRPVTFTAGVFPNGTGTVTFIVDGLARPPARLAVVDGLPQVVLTTTGLGVGAHTVTAVYGGDHDFAPSTSRPVTLVVNPPPAVVLLRRLGIHDQPTLLALTFNRPMNAATVQDRRNYALYPVGPRGLAGPHPVPIPIVSAVYDPARQTVTLAPKSRLTLTGYYLLTVNGDGPGRLVDVTGIPLVGTNTGGRPGAYIATIHGFGPWLTPSPFVFAVPQSPAQFFTRR